MAMAIALPTFDQMLVPTVQALQELGGSGSIEEINTHVAQLLNLPDEILEISHGTTSQSEVAYRLAWSRTYLKKYGLVENSSRGIWSLVATIPHLGDLDPKDIVKAVREAHLASKAPTTELKPQSQGDQLEGSDRLDTNRLDEDITWQETLHKTLLALTPDAFERLAQRLLRESGFIQVQVTGKSGDGGIDGVGIARINGFLSFHVLFQCKRYQGSVTASQVRDFRGAMQGRTDKGLLITTGTFTRDAIREAVRDGAPPIDLIDGEQLVQRLKELGLGVNITLVESVDVDTEWFAKL